MGLLMEHVLMFMLADLHLALGMMKRKKMSQLRSMKMIHGLMRVHLNVMKELGMKKMDIARKTNEA